MFAVIPFGEHWLGLAELDFESRHQAASPDDESQTIASAIRIGNKPFKGFMWYGVFEHASIANNGGYNLTHSPGVGVQWLPFPHINLQMEYQRSVSSQGPGGPNHVGWFLVHLYL